MNSLKQFSLESSYAGMNIIALNLMNWQLLLFLLLEMQHSLVVLFGIEDVFLRSLIRI